VQGFRMAAESGPLCGEPLWGVCFVVEEVELRGGGMAAPAPAPALPAPFSPGAAMSTMRDACRVAVLAGAPRLVEAFYSCQLTCAAGRGAGSSGEQLGRLYAVLARRRARVLGEDMWEGTSTFVIAALLPVAESFGFADDLRKRTSGAATSPQLLFSHWEPLAQDPFYAPTTDEERERLGDRVHDGQGHNLAKRYVDAVRARKGLRSDKKAVERAEAQRTRKRQ
jgi:ribosome assembly protein 1